MDDFVDQAVIDQGLQASVNLQGIAFREWCCR
jgi:hypothetical protein